MALWLHHHQPLDCVGQEDQLPNGPGHLGDVGVLSPRVDQGWVTPSVSCQDNASSVDECDPDKFNPDLQWMSSSPKEGVYGHGSGLGLS